MTGSGPFILGLTGSIGMGKSTTAGFFRDLGVPVWDADAAVHRLYRAGGAAVTPLAALVQGVLTDGAVDRTALKRWLAKTPDGLQHLEQIVHPLVAQDRALFLAAEKDKGTPFVVVDIPLLFETGADAWCDATLVVTAPTDIQRKRVMARAGMTKAQFSRMTAAQMPDQEKQSRADYVIQAVVINETEKAVKDLWANLTGRADSNV